mmetsp:Transcript_14617/g.36752  ORF Transcript_14617/g.36752 Transcript_14617/m.36752 type:complete len:331 (-) Transcript_14617:1141-2133(-)
MLHLLSTLEDRLLEFEIRYFSLDFTIDETLAGFAIVTRLVGCNSDSTKSIRVKGFLKFKLFLVILLDCWRVQLGLRWSHSQIESIIVLNTVVCKSERIVELVALEFQDLLLGRNALAVAKHVFHIVWSSRSGVDIQCNLLTTWQTDMDSPWFELEGVLVLDADIVQRLLIIHKKIGVEHQALILALNACLVLNLRFDVSDGIRRIDCISSLISIEIDDVNFHRQQFNHVTVADAIILQRAPLWQWLAIECRALILGWDSKLFLYLLLNVINAIIRIDHEIGNPAIWSLNLNYHGLQMNCVSMADVVVSQSSVVFQCLSIEFGALIFRCNS